MEGGKERCREGKKKKNIRKELGRRKKEIIKNTREG